MMVGVPANLVIVGDGPHRSYCEFIAKEFKIDVQFTGSLPLTSLPSYYQAADLLVLPSSSEGVPNVLLEASACGLPWLASNVGGIPEIAHLGASRLVRRDDDDAFAAAISGDAGFSAAAAEYCSTIAHRCGCRTGRFSERNPRFLTVAARMSDMLCFSHDWSGDPLSKTHLMRLLARRGHRVLWVNSIGYRTPSLAAKRDLGRIVKKLKAAAEPIREVGAESVRHQSARHPGLGQGLRFKK